MPFVKFTTALNRFFPDLKERNFTGKRVCEVLDHIESAHPGVKAYLLDEQGQLRPHINIFVRGELMKDREHLQDVVDEQDEILVFQALSGG
ncbi:MAG: MoaD/ThiS family protein [Bacteroidota bacterium]